MPCVNLITSHSPPKMHSLPLRFPLCIVYARSIHLPTTNSDAHHPLADPPLTLILTGSCLTDPKEITLLPCRHHCVCAKCMSRLEQCPVCRTPFLGYLRAPPPQPLRCSAEAAELGGQMSGGDEGGATDSAEGGGARV